jgi:hypothetical protein
MGQRRLVDTGTVLCPECNSRLWTYTVCCTEDGAYTECEFCSHTFPVFIDHAGPWRAMRRQEPNDGHRSMDFDWVKYTVGRHILEICELTTCPTGDPTGPYLQAILERHYQKAGQRSMVMSLKAAHHNIQRCSLIVFPRNNPLRTWEWDYNQDLNTGKWVLP